MFVHRFLEQTNCRNCTHAKTLNEDVQVTHFAEEETVMPALLWVAFWSSLMATAACFGEMSRQPPIDKRDGGDSAGA
jgi:hypothetical protein